MHDTPNITHILLGKPMSLFLLEMMIFQIVVEFFGNFSFDFARIKVNCLWQGSKCIPYLSWLISFGIDAQLSRWIFWSVYVSRSDFASWIRSSFLAEIFFYISVLAFIFVWIMYDTHQICVIFLFLSFHCILYFYSENAWKIWLKVYKTNKQNKQVTNNINAISLYSIKKFQSLHVSCFSLNLIMTSFLMT